MGLMKKMKKKFGPKGTFGPLGKNFNPIKGKMSPGGMLRGKADNRPIGGAHDRYPYKFE